MRSASAELPSKGSAQRGTSSTSGFGLPGRAVAGEEGAQWHSAPPSPAVPAAPPCRHSHAFDLDVRGLNLDDLRRRHLDLDELAESLAGMLGRTLDLDALAQSFAQSLEGGDAGSGAGGSGVDAPRGVDPMRLPASLAETAAGAAAAASGGGAPHPASEPPPAPAPAPARATPPSTTPTTAPATSNATAPAPTNGRASPFEPPRSPPRRRRPGLSSDDDGEPIAPRASPPPSLRATGAETDVISDAEIAGAYDHLAVNGEHVGAMRLVLHVAAARRAPADELFDRALGSLDPSLLEQLGAAERRAVLGHIARSLRAVRRVDDALPWLEHALRMRMRGGLQLGERARAELLGALRGLSAAPGPSGVLAAKASALLSIPAAAGCSPTAASAGRGRRASHQRPAWQATGTDLF